MGSLSLNTLESTEIAWLAKYQHPDGGVAYLPGRQPRIEPTCYAVLTRVARERDIHWLRQQVPSQLIVSDETNPTHIGQTNEARPWVVAASMVALNSHNDLRKQLNPIACAQYLRKHHAVDADGQSTKEGSFLHETKLAGALPWNDGNYGWVQPTCWATFAELSLLSTTTKKSVQEVLLENLSLRLEFLLSRKTADEGWNYGNTIVLDTLLSAHPFETALVLAALGGIRNSAVASYLMFTRFEPEPSLVRLEKLLEKEGSRLTLAWSAIAHSCWKRSPPDQADFTSGPPTPGESVVDALSAMLVASDLQQTGFHFLLPTSQP